MFVAHQVIQRVMEDLLYCFVVTDIASGLIFVRRSTNALVYASLGLNKKQLLKTARNAFNQLSKKTEVHYNFKQIEVESDKVIAAKFDEIVQQFRLLLEGHEVSNLHYEYMFGTPLQHRIWDELVRIPHGRVSTYKEIADRLNIRNGSRAVGNGVGSNNIAVVIPCHRVVGSNGTLTGYKWSTSLKRKLLEREHVYSLDMKHEANKDTKISLMKYKYSA